jgi:hypothetical protein
MSDYPPEQGDLSDANQSFHDEYKRIAEHTRARLGTRGWPVIIANGRELVFLHDGKREAVPLVPPHYHRLKAVSHIPFGIYLCVKAHGFGSLDDEIVARLRELLTTVERVKAGLEDFAPEHVPTQHAVLDRCAAFLRTCLDHGEIDGRSLEAFAKAVAPDLLQSAGIAARLQLDSMHETVSRWRAETSGPAWSLLNVMVCSGHQSRYRETAIQYFTRLLGEEQGSGAQHEHHVLYAEGVAGEEEALRLLASHIIDRHASMAFFGSWNRLQEDLLSEGTATHLRELLPRR